LAELFTAIIIAFLVVGVIYTLVEFFEVFAAHRDSPKKPVAGAESAIGKSAVVVRDFSSLQEPRPIGRVRFEGENWNAVFVGNRSESPRAGDRVSIVDIDAANLKVKVQ